MAGGAGRVAAAPVAGEPIGDGEHCGCTASPARPASPLPSGSSSGRSSQAAWTAGVRDVAAAPTPARTASPSADGEQCPSPPLPPWLTSPAPRALHPPLSSFVDPGLLAAARAGRSVRLGEKKKRAREEEGGGGPAHHRPPPARPPAPSPGRPAGPPPLSGASRASLPPPLSLVRLAPLAPRARPAAVPAQAPPPPPPPPPPLPPPPTATGVSGLPLLPSAAAARARTPCAFWAAGKCAAGAACAFSHDATPRTAGTVCKFHRRGECAKGRACEWSHDLSAEPCRRLLLVGACERAGRGACPFSHDVPTSGPEADAARAFHLEQERARVALGMRPAAGCAGVVCGGGDARPAPPPEQPAADEGALVALAVQGGAAWAARPRGQVQAGAAAGDLLAGVLSSAAT